MDAAAVLRRNRLGAGLTQRELAGLIGVPQPAIARIESGAVVPRVDTFERLLRGCGKALRVDDQRGRGVDRSVIRALLDLSPRARLELAAEEARKMADFDEAVGGMSRSAFDPLGALGVLVDHGVHFVLIGGLAGRTYGSNLITNGLDICHERTPANVARLVEALKEMSARLRGVEDEVPFSLEPATILAGDTFTFDTDLGALDCIGTPTGTGGYRQLIKGAAEVGMGVFTIRVASLDDLVAMKEATGRPKDREAIEVLAALEDERRGRTNPDPS